MHKNLKLGWIGLGVMGAPMCGHLLAAGYPVSVYTRSRHRAEPLLEAGAKWCESPRDVADDADVIFTMVGTAQEVRDVYFSTTGLFSTDIRGKLFVDMGTTAPGLTTEIAVYCEQHDADSLDAPVSGGDVGARAGTLSIMAGGRDEDIATVSGLFDCLGTYRHLGGHGSGQHCKMCNQITVAGSMIGVCEALVYAARAGLDRDRMIAAISSGAAACWALDKLAPRIVERDYDPGFMVDHFIKDLGIALQQCELMGLELPGLSLARSLYRQVSELGHGRSGTQALIMALDTGSGVACADAETG